MKSRKIIKRLYDAIAIDHFRQNRQMLFFMGPRQVGKTTSSLLSGKELDDFYYFNWDDSNDRAKILEGSETIAATARLEEHREEPTTIIFDEIHKYSGWKDFLKGFFDKFADDTHILVTGSARMEVFRRSGDSLMGRYFRYRMHPLSIGELLYPSLRKEEILPHPRNLDEDQYESLFRFGGFPEPFLRNNAHFYTQWKSLRSELLFQEDLRDLTQVQEIAQMEILAEILRHQVGQLSSYTSFARKVRISVDTARRWIEILKGVYYCFAIRPWTKNVTRSLLKEPKYYLWDWSLVEDKGARYENFVASHLLKSVQFWTDAGFGDFGLYFIRDKMKREVDFIVTKNQEPWFLVEVKTSSKQSLSSNLSYFHQKLGTKHAFQVAMDKEYVDRTCFNSSEPLIVSGRTFLSHLV